VSKSDDIRSDINTMQGNVGGGNSVGMGMHVPSRG
jgi:hypothetical protein